MSIVNLIDKWSDFDRYKVTRKGFVRLGIKQDCDNASMSLFERSYTVPLSGVKYFVQVVLQIIFCDLLLL